MVNTLHSMVSNLFLTLCKIVVYILLLLCFYILILCCLLYFSFLGDSLSVFMRAVKLLDEGEDARYKIEAALSNIESLDSVIAEVAAEIESEKSLQLVIFFFTNILSILFN